MVHLGTVSSCLVDDDWWKHTMDLLTGRAMAVFGVQGLLTAQLIGDLAAMTTSLIACLEVFCLIVDSIRGTMLPFVEFSLCGTLISVVTVRSVRGCHVSLPGVRDDLI